MKNAGRLKQVGAVGGNRTPDLTLTKRLLYQINQFNDLPQTIKIARMVII
jgi:hypothetical protein